MALDLRAELRKTANELSPYTLENSRKVASYVLSFYHPDSISSAVQDAELDQMENLKENRIRIFIPCMRDISYKLEALLLNFDIPNKMKRGDTMSGQGIFGTFNSALKGRTVMGESPLAFFVYDYNAGIVVDSVNREAKSTMNQGTKTDYINSMERLLGFEVAWKESEA